jgi:hypothetical protein
MSWTVRIAIAIAIAGGLLAAHLIDGAVDYRDRESAAYAGAEVAVPTRRARPALPTMPEVDREAARAAFADALLAGSSRPGAAAFRSHTDRFLAANPELVRAQAASVGLSEAEVGELTYFAMAVQKSQSWTAVETLVGHPIRPQVRANVAGLMHGDSEQMKLELRAHVDAGDGPGVRLATIRRIQDHYWTEYFALTGMSSDKLDTLLADAVLGDEIDLGAVASKSPARKPPVVRPRLAPRQVAELEAEAAAGNDRLAAELASEGLR